MGIGDLAKIVLKKIGHVAMQDADLAGAQRRGVFARSDAVTGRLHSDHPHSRIVQKRIEQPHGIAAAPYRSYQVVGKPALRLSCAGSWPRDR